MTPRHLASGPNVSRLRIVLVFEGRYADSSWTLRSLKLKALIFFRSVGIRLLSHAASCPRRRESSYKY